MPEDIARRWVPGDGPVELWPQAAGLTNRTYRVARGGRQYSLRIAPPGRATEREREWECRVLTLAVAAGLAPPVHACRCAEGILVADWVDGRTWTPGEVRHPDNIARVAALVRRLQALRPEPVLQIAPAGWVSYYVQLRERSGAPASAALRERVRAAHAWLERLAALPPRRHVLCHGDLHRHNVVVVEAQQVLLDWEYARVTDPFWDLAGWVVSNGGTEAFASALLESYLTRPATPQETLRLELLRGLYGHVCLEWSELYLGPTPHFP